MKHTLLVAIITVISAVVACDRDNANSLRSSSAQSKVTLQLNWKPEPQFGGFYAAQVIEAYAKHGLNVDIREGGAGAPTVDMLAAGTVPFAIVSGDEIVIARSRGKKIVALLAVYQTHPQGIMARAGRGFPEIADIFRHEGTLAMEQGLGYSEFLKKKFGFDKLKVVPTPFGDLSFIRNDPNYAMQCFVTSEPIAAKRIGLEVTTFLIADAGYNPYATVLATTDDYLKQNRATVEAMVAAVREGWQAYLSDPAPTNELMHRLNPTMDKETFALAAEAQKPLIQGKSASLDELGAMTSQRWEELGQQLVSLKIIDQAPPAGECFVSLMTSPAATAPAWTHELITDEPYYLSGPQQGRPPDGTFPAGTKVHLLESAGSYSRASAEDGTTAWVATAALRPRR